MDPHHLRLLRELGDRGSVAAVARALHITPSAVSQQLNTLQRSSRVPLTERRGRRLALTDAGRALATAAVDVMTALDRASRAVGEYLDDPAAPVSVAAFNSAALAMFAPLVARLAASGGPRVHLCDQDVTQADFPALAADFDLVLAHRPAHSPPWPADRVTVLPLLHEPLYVAMPAAHPLAAAPSLSVSDISDEPWISVQEGFPVAASLTAVVAAAGRPLNILHRINEFTVAASLVASGAALALLPGYTTPPDPRLVLRPLADVPASRHIDILTRPESLHRTAVRTVADTLRAIATDLAAPR
ncbi:LysR family transcriptional regulator [Actinoplanes sp. NPDC051851]|uniref:LysR family transcriptional regulator n=1 Tax=Actinoplanes sp. NPDC051851 TaxID=3154753 RepID=UPI00343AEEF6